MNQTFVFYFGLKIQITNVRVQKIDNTIPKTYGIVVSTFSILNKNDKKRFLNKSFLLADIKVDIIFGIFFQIISNTDIDF